MKTIIRLLTVAFLIASVTEARSEKVQYGGPAPTSRNLKQTTAGCTPSSTFAWLNINNAKVRVNAGGDMWWDLPGGSGAKYYIPANGSATSLYAGSLWIAGMDVNNQLKCAAVRFRQGLNFNGGNDFWTGPLTVDGTASIDAQTCMMYDKMYNITRAEVDEFLANCDPKTGIPYPEYISKIPANIMNWPAHGEVAGISHYLAPFYDNDGDGEYNPAVGDYPFYDIENKYCHTKVPTMEEQYGGTLKGSILADQLIKGDQTIWWVFNDKGNAHTETGGSAIGMEIRAQAFAFATNDEINNMTFYSYEIINRSTYTLTNTYFSPWTDVDLGYAKDDYVGCDVSRGLGYGYNGAPVDGNGEPEAYGANPPAVGVDFFQGPYLDPDGIDNPKYTYTTIGGVTDSVQNCDESINGVNFGNGIIDDERFGMRRFVYHNNSDKVNGDPKEAAEYYLLLRGIWKNGAKMEYGGTAVPGEVGVVGPACDFMFPFDSDPCNWGTGGLTPGGIFAQDGVYWSEETGNNGSPNPADDRRFMQSAGPFTLKAGAVNYITFGVPWARANTGEAWASVELLRKVDDKCQSMFDRCFKVLDGPDAPDLTIRELDRQLIVYISNSPSSNNANEDYMEEDQDIKGNNPDGSEKDPYYRFEGYQIYQLANNTVSVDELTDDTKARLIFQCDVDNNVGQIINWVQDEDLKVSVPTLMVQGADNGITHSFVVTQDAFTINTDPTLVNHKTYYFMAIAYAYNNYFEYKVDETEPDHLFGQKTPYLAGRKNIKLYSAVPHKIVNGTVVNSSYQSQPAIRRWAGLGNGGNRIELEKGVEETILAKGLAVQFDGERFHKIPFGSEEYPIEYHPSYKAGFGPIDVKVVDPLNVVPTDYSLFMGDFSEVTMHGVTGNASIVGDTAIKKTAKWYLHDMQEDGVYYESNKTIENANEMLFLERGLSITITQPYNIGPVKVGSQGIDNNNTPIPAYQVIAPKNGMLYTTVTYADSSNRWLGGIYDDDDYVGTPLNWIRSGTYGDQDNAANNDYKVKSGAGDKGSQPFDPNENYEHIADGTWAPYVLTYVSGTVEKNFPGPMYELYDQSFAEKTFFNTTRSIDIVMTADKSKWTRCPVIEMCMNKELSDGNVGKFYLRDAASVDKNGIPAAQIGPSDNPDDPNYISDHGMGWFPGYAIDVETGIRLNMMFGEDSFLKNMNGDDMQFNPVAIKENTVLGLESQYSDPALFDPVDKTPLMGGKHYVYILPMSEWDVMGGHGYEINFAVPAYDGGATTINILDSIAGAPSSLQKNFMKAFWRLPGWVGMPMAIEGREWLQPGNPVRISVRISKPYEPGFGDFPLQTESDKLKEYIDESDTTLMRLYNFPNPYYTFSTKDMVPTKFEANKQKSDLDLIRVVPNPYYAWSSYEANALTHKVKIVNVPDKCVVTIYTVNGTKIRQFKKDDASTTSIDWDLTNHANTPIASGIYLIHVKDLAAGGGEKTVKFYCAMRQVDLNTF